MLVPKVIIGGGVALGAGVPLGLYLGKEKIAIHSANSTYKRWISPEGPILDCRDSSSHYQIFLTFAGGGESVGKETDVPVLKTVVLKDERKINKGLGAKVGSTIEQWRLTNLERDQKQVVLEISPNGAQDWRGGWAEQFECTGVVNMEWTKPSEFNSIDAKDISFNLSGKSCEVKVGELGKKDCDVSISSAGDKLKWKIGFKPQAHFRAIS